MRKLATTKSDRSVSWSFVILLTCSGKAQEMLIFESFIIITIIIFFFLLLCYMITDLRFPYIKTSFDSFTADIY